MPRWVGRARVPPRPRYEGVLRGNFVSGGELTEIAWGEGVQSVRFSDRSRTVLPIPWGDLETAYRTTRIPNITTLMAVPESAARLLALARTVTTTLMPKLMAGLGSAGVRELVPQGIERYVKNPDAVARRQGRAYVWARAATRNGQAREAWLDTVDGYALTAESAVLALEDIAKNRPVGALTPAQALARFRAGDRRQRAARQPARLDSLMPLALTVAPEDQRRSR